MPSTYPVVAVRIFSALQMQSENEEHHNMLSTCSVSQTYTRILLKVGINTACTTCQHSSQTSHDYVCHSAKLKVAQGLAMA
jgi:hypothetical protein